MNTEKKDFYNYSFEELQTLFKDEFKTPAFHARQVFEWVYQKHVKDFSQMSDVPAKLHSVLSEFFYFSEYKIASRQISSDGTRKYLFELAPTKNQTVGNTVEAVMIKQPARMTLCVSSQVGCAMACAFCRTGTMGLIRNLTTSEILHQVMGVIEDAKNFDDMFQNIVFMGMGEPLHNYENVTRALRILTHPKGFGIGTRRITVSSVGLVPAIEKFGVEKVPGNLAISLNATTDEIREKIMPIDKRYNLETLLKTLKNYPTTKQKKITIEYVMLKGVNDSEEDLRRLPKLLHGIPVKVNLIPYNDNAGLGFETPDRKWVYHWQQTLSAKGFESSIRWSKGRDISAACGQLATADKKVRINREAGIPIYEAPESSILKQIVVVLINVLLLSFLKYLIKTR